MIYYILCAVIAAAGCFAGGYFLGKRKGKEKVDSNLINIAMTWKNVSEKQAKTINDINERLRYYTVGEIADLYEYLIENEEAEDSDPVLGLVMSDGEFIDWKTEKGD